MAKRPLEETQVVRKLHDEEDSQSRLAKKRRTVSELDKGIVTDGVAPPEQLRKKERKERKCSKKLEGKEHHQTDETVLGADGEGGAPITGMTNAAIKAARKGRKVELTGEMKADGQSDHKTKVISSITRSRTGASRAKSDIITTTEATNQSSVVASTPENILKCGYVEDPSLAALPQFNIEAFVSSNFITIDDPIKTSPTLRPITEFSYLPISDSSQRAPFRSFSSPTPIQAAAWPFLLSGRDVIGVAETGSGKTLAFGVPCIRYITSLPKRERWKGPKAVIISPTRELALQIHGQLLRLATPAGLEAVCVYGGVQKEVQRRALKSASIVVATPGRLNDFISEGDVDLGSIGYLVLDEADRMLDKGFEEDIKRIIRTTPPHGVRQTLMFTATWPQSVRELAATFMKSPVKISIGDNPNGELRANNRITQKVEVVDPRGKEVRLLQLIKEHQSGKHKDDRILVFCLYKKEATRVETYLRMKGFRVAGIHGDLSQQQRTTSLEAFKSAKVPLLVATDVAARGLDIPAVKLVVNVTFPLTVEDYVHRIGR